MYLEYVEKLDKSSILSPELMDELFEIDDEYEREVNLQDILDRAKTIEVGLKDKFERRYKAKLRAVKASKKNEVKEYVPHDNCTDFSIAEEQLNCGDWIANDHGVSIHTEKGIAVACPHPIFPTMILRNAETGRYKVELKFLIRNNIRTALVDREVIASPSKILKLANDSVQVTALNAPYLVQYLSDIEAMNPELISERASTSRLGWIDGVDSEGNEVKKFLPYEQEVVFDNELNTKSLFDSVKACGSRDIWYGHIKELRAKKQIELLINIAASFASVLVEPCGALPFIVSLWGGTGIGKTVILKVATSIWADAGEGKYITDAKATNTAMEVRLNILNSLPMTLDDMAQIKNQYDEDFSQLIYRWCAGKGRDRSNTELGLNKLTSWRNCTITNGERSLIDESTQGGAVNRVIDVEATGEVIFDGERGNETSQLVEKNYGFAGWEFVELIQGLGFDEIDKIKNDYFRKIKEIASAQGVEKEDKQIVPMALILTADQLTEEYLFQDGVRLDIEKCVRFLKNKGEVSEHKRAYEFLIGYIAANAIHFADNELEDMPNIERWGYYKNENTIVINGTVFDSIMKKGSFQSRAFLSWAKKENLLETDSRGCPRKAVNYKGNHFKAVVIKTNYGFEESENDDFMQISDDLELPFD